MLVQNTLQETTETSAERSPIQDSTSPSGRRSSEAQRPTSSTRSRKPLVWLAAAAALAVVVTVTVTTLSAQAVADPARVSDGSFEQNEANRFEQLRNLTTGTTTDGSFDQNEANRLELLRDTTGGT